MDGDNLFSNYLIQSGFESLLKDGFVKLPPIGSELDKNSIYEAIYEESGGRNFSSSLKTHKKLLSQLGLDNILGRELLEVAKSEFGYVGDFNDQYHVARFVSPGDKESYRTHFDSHIFTLVIPIKIPMCEYFLGSGELLFRPKARPYHQSELVNLVSKIYHKRYAGRRSVEMALSKNFFKIEDFRDDRPILFLGNTTLHTNAPVHRSANTPRLTCISHFFDPGRGKSVGGFLRKLRRR